MANFNITGDTTAITSTSTVTGLGLNSGNATITLPVANPTGATPSLPRYLANVDNTGLLEWVSGTDASANDFNSAAIYTLSTAGTSTLTVGTMAPTLAGPISAKITMVGGGGAGASMQNTTSNILCSAGGGGGATSVKIINGLSPDSSFTFTVGAAGLPSVITGIGGAGGDTLVTYGANIYGSRGGSGAGVGMTSVSDPRALLAGFGGTTTTPTGANAPADYVSAGAPGGAGSNTAIGVAFGQVNSGGGTLLGTPSYGPGAVGSTAQINGNIGLGAGTGGTGCFSAGSSGSGINAGGNGSTGLVILEFFGVNI